MNPQEAQELGSYRNEQPSVSKDEVFFLFVLTSLQFFNCLLNAVQGIPTIFLKQLSKISAEIFVGPSYLRYTNVSARMSRIRMQVAAEFTAEGRHP